MKSDGESRRFCLVCTKNVHDLSAMTEQTARAVLASESAKGRVCVRYTTDASGKIRFRTETVEAPSLWRMTLAAAGVAMAMLTGCADAEPDRITAEHCVYEVGPWSFTAERGQGTCPAADPEPEEMLMGELEAVIEPPPEPVHELMGDVAAPVATMGEAPPPRPEPVRMGKIAMPPSEQPCDPQDPEAPKTPEAPK
ncbi:MAG: hypothetical protein R6X02_03060 [Enhygromyxa sp.]